MTQSFKNGQSSVILRLKLLDTSSTDGGGLTGLTFSSTGLIISTIADNESTATAYTVAGSTIENITTLGTFAAPTATKCRFKEVDATNHKGVYEFQIADARYAVSNAKSLLISVSGATNLQQADYIVPLLSDDPFVPKPTNSSLLSIDANGRMDLSKFAGQTITAAAGVTIPSTIASPTNITAGTITTVTNLTNAPTAGDFTATMKTSLNAATPASVVGSVGSVTAGVTVTTNNDKTGYQLSSTGVNDILRTALTEGYAADGAAFTLEQALFMLWSLMAEKSVAGTTLTAKKLDGSTNAMTFTLDSATAPTSITRAT